MNLEPLFSFFIGLAAFMTISYLSLQLNKKVKKNWNERIRNLFHKGLFLFSFIAAFFVLKIFGVELSYWTIIIGWGIFNFIISYTKMKKWIRLLLYTLSFLIIWRFSGLKITYIKNDQLFTLSPIISVFYFLVVTYLFSYLSDLKGFANGIFFILTLSIFIGVKFFARVGIEELDLIAFLIAISFGIFIFELAIPHYKIERAEGRFYGFLIALFSVYSNTNALFFETILLPLFVLFGLILIYLLSFYPNFKKGRKKDYIIQYPKYDIFIFVYLVLFSVCLIGIFFKEIGSSHLITILSVIVFLVLEFYFFLQFLEKKKNPVKKDLKKIDLFGIKVNNNTFNETAELIENAILNEKKLFIVTLNPVMVMNSFENKNLLSAYRNADLILPDGIGIVWASYFLGTPLKQRVTGIEIAANILNNPVKPNMKVLLFGAKKGIAKRIQKEFIQKYPALDIEILDGYSNYRERENLRIRVRNNSYDLILVALGSPAQELWINKEYNNKFTEKGIFIGVGGSFDVLSGLKKRVADKWKKKGLEWFFRIISEPQKRLNQIFHLFNFALKVFIERLE
jgi:N-acetylglucosaminyldiphosphoundecaprenol N-acetyl-beta-D-mannosaminyltransferase